MLLGFQLSRKYQTLKKKATELNTRTERGQQTVI